jgi:hypothetical protein
MSNYENIPYHNLKSIAADRGIDATGKKAELVARLDTADKNKESAPEEPETAPETPSEAPDSDVEVKDVDNAAIAKGERQVKAKDVRQKVQTFENIIVLPDDASPAQKQFAKSLNAYAYQNPDKWEEKKERLLDKLESLRGMDKMPGGRNTQISIGENLADDDEE